MVKCIHCNREAGLWSFRCYCDPVLPDTPPPSPPPSPPQQVPVTPPGLEGSSPVPGDGASPVLSTAEEKTSDTESQAANQSALPATLETPPRVSLHVLSLNIGFILDLPLMSQFVPFPRQS